MLTIQPAMLRDLAVQSTDALGTVLANLVVDRDRLFIHSVDKAIRPHWIASDMSGVEAFTTSFPYDVETTGPEQTITLYARADVDFVLVLARLAGETETEALIVGEGFVLHSRNLLRRTWEIVEVPQIRNLLDHMGF